MKGKRFDSLILRKHMFPSKIDCHLKRCPSQSETFHLIFAVTAQENILIVKSIIYGLPLQVML